MLRDWLSYLSLARSDYLSERYTPKMQNPLAATDERIEEITTILNDIRPEDWSDDDYTHLELIARIESDRATIADLRAKLQEVSPTFRLP